MRHDIEHLVHAGMSVDRATTIAGHLDECNAALDKIKSAPTRWSVWVPGRVELFGKHTDYAGGRSLLCAVERGFAVSAAPRKDGEIHAIDVAHREAFHTSLSTESQQGGADGGWPLYVAAVARRLAMNFPSASAGVDLAFISDLPMAAGLSSSSALMISVFVALAKANDLRSSEEFRREIFSREELATYLGCMENGAAYRSLAGDQGVGTMGGSQDHTAIMCSVADRVIQYGWVPVRREAVYRFPSTHTLVIASSGVAANKAKDVREQYNRAARMAQHILQGWNVATGRKDRSLGDAVRSSAKAPEELRQVAQRCANETFQAHELLKRIDQFMLESFEIIPAVAAALAGGRIDDVGALAARSQRAAEEWLGNQVPETVALTQIARDLGATAASSFGAGFGGSVWAIVPLGQSEQFIKKWHDAYCSAFPLRTEQAEFFVSALGPGGMQWT
jgi:galactokinase